MKVDTDKNPPSLIPDRQESFDIISALSEKPRKRPQPDSANHLLRYAPPKKLFTDPRQSLPPIKSSSAGPSAASARVTSAKKAPSAGAVERFQQPMKDREAFRSALVKAIM